MRLRLPLASQFRSLQWRHGHYVLFFSAGAGLELFMNFFHVGEVNIYRSIKRSMSDSRAIKQFELEKNLYEKIQNDRNEV